MSPWAHTNADSQSLFLSPQERAAQDSPGPNDPIGPAGKVQQPPLVLQGILFWPDSGHWVVWINQVRIDASNWRSISLNGRWQIQRVTPQDVVVQDQQGHSLRLTPQVPIAGVLAPVPPMDQACPHTPWTGRAGATDGAGPHTTDSDPAHQMPDEGVGLPQSEQTEATQEDEAPGTIDLPEKAPLDDSVLKEPTQPAAKGRAVPSGSEPKALRKGVLGRQTRAEGAAKEEPLEDRPLNPLPLADP